jgi:hypothetical protein
MIQVRLRDANYFSSSAQGCVIENALALAAPQIALIMRINRTG